MTPSIISTLANGHQVIAPPGQAILLWAMHEEDGPFRCSRIEPSPLPGWVTATLVKGDAVVDINLAGIVSAMWGEAKEIHHYANQC